MNLADVARMILAESAGLPDLTRVSRFVYDEASTGRALPHATLRWMLREAGLQGVFRTLDRKHGGTVVRDMILFLGHEVDRGVLLA